MKKLFDYVKRKRGSKTTSGQFNANVAVYTQNKTPFNYASSESFASSSDTISIYEPGSANKGWTKLHIAAWVGDVPKLKSKLKKIDIGAKDDLGRTALHLAAAQGHIDAVSFLVACKADATIQDDCGKTPLHKATEFGHRECMQKLLDNSVISLVNIPDMVGDTPLHVATELGNYDSCLTLLQMGADIEAQNSRKQFPLHKACLSDTRDTYELIELLLRHGSLINVGDIDNVTPLMIACSQGSINVVRLFIEYGADIEAKDSHGKTSYDYAAEHNFCDIEELVKFGDESMLERATIKKNSSRETINVITPPNEFASIDSSDWPDDLELPSILEKLPNAFFKDLECGDTTIETDMPHDAAIPVSTEVESDTSPDTIEQPVVELVINPSDCSSPFHDARTNSLNRSHSGQGDLNSRLSNDDVPGVKLPNENNVECDRDTVDSSGSDWDDDFSLPIDDKPRVSLKKSPFHMVKLHIQDEHLLENLETAFRETLSLENSSSPGDNALNESQPSVSNIIGPLITESDRKEEEHKCHQLEHEENNSIEHGRDASSWSENSSVRFNEVETGYVDLLGKNEICNDDLKIESTSKNEAIADSSREITHIMDPPSKICDDVQCTRQTIDVPIYENEIALVASNENCQVSKETNIYDDRAELVSHGLNSVDRMSSNSSSLTNVSIIDENVHSNFSENIKSRKIPEAGVIDPPEQDIFCTNVAFETHLPEDISEHPNCNIEELRQFVITDSETDHRIENKCIPKSEDRLLPYSMNFIGTENITKNSSESLNSISDTCSDPFWDESVKQTSSANLLSAFGGFHLSTASKNADVGKDEMLGVDEIWVSNEFMLDDVHPEDSKHEESNSRDVKSIPVMEYGNILTSSPNCDDLRAYKHDVSPHESSLKENDVPDEEASAMSAHVAKHEPLQFDLALTVPNYFHRLPKLTTYTNDRITKHGNIVTGSSTPTRIPDNVTEKFESSFPRSSDAEEEHVGGTSDKTEVLSENNQLTPENQGRRSVHMEELECTLDIEEESLRSSTSSNSLENTANLLDMTRDIGGVSRLVDTDVTEGHDQIRIENDDLDEKSLSSSPEKVHEEHWSFEDPTRSRHNYSPHVSPFRRFSPRPKFVPLTLGENNHWFVGSFGRVSECSKDPLAMKRNSQKGIRYTMLDYYMDRSKLDDKILSSFRGDTTISGVKLYQPFGNINLHRLSCSLGSMINTNAAGDSHSVDVILRKYQSENENHDHERDLPSNQPITRKNARGISIVKPETKPCFEKISPIIDHLENTLVIFTSSIFSSLRDTEINSCTIEEMEDQRYVDVCAEIAHSVGSDSVSYEKCNQTEESTPEKEEGQITVDLAPVFEEPGASVDSFWKLACSSSTVIDTGQFDGKIISSAGISPFISGEHFLTIPEVRTPSENNVEACVLYDSKESVSSFGSLKSSEALANLPKSGWIGNDSGDESGSDTWSVKIQTSNDSISSRLKEQMKLLAGFSYGTDVGEHCNENQFTNLDITTNISKVKPDEVPRECSQTADMGSCCIIPPSPFNNMEIKHLYDANTSGTWGSIIDRVISAESISTEYSSTNSQDPRPKSVKVNESSVQTAPDNMIVEPFEAVISEVSERGNSISVGSDVREAVILLREDYNVVEATLKKHNNALEILSSKLYGELLSDSSYSNVTAKGKSRSTMDSEKINSQLHLRALEEELEILRKKLVDKNFDETSKALDIVEFLREEKRALQTTINGLNETLIDQRMKVAELKEQNERYRVEKQTLQNDLEVQIAEVNCLAQKTVTSDPSVIEKIANLEQQNKELEASYQKLLQTLGIPGPSSPENMLEDSPIVAYHFEDLSNSDPNTHQRQTEIISALITDDSVIGCDKMNRKRKNNLSEGLPRTYARESLKDPFSFEAEHDTKMMSHDDANDDIVTSREKKIKINTIDGQESERVTDNSQTEIFDKITDRKVGPSNDGYCMQKKPKLQKCVAIDATDDEDSTEGKSYEHEEELRCVKNVWDKVKNIVSKREHRSGNVEPVKNNSTKNVIDGVKNGENEPEDHGARSAKEMGNLSESKVSKVHTSVRSDGNQWSYRPLNKSNVSKHTKPPSKLQLRRVHAEAATLQKKKSREFPIRKKAVTQRNVGGKSLQRRRGLPGNKSLDVLSTSEKKLNLCTVNNESEKLMKNEVHEMFVGVTNPEVKLKNDEQSALKLNGNSNSTDRVTQTKLSDQIEPSPTFSVHYPSISSLASAISREFGISKSKLETKTESLVEIGPQTPDECKKKVPDEEMNVQIHPGFHESNKSNFVDLQNTLHNNGYNAIKCSPEAKGNITRVCDKSLGKSIIVKELSNTEDNDFNTVNKQQTDEHQPLKAGSQEEGYTAALRKLKLELILNVTDDYSVDCMEVKPLYDNVPIAKKKMEIEYPSRVDDTSGEIPSYDQCAVLQSPTLNTCNKSLKNKHAVSDHCDRRGLITDSLARIENNLTTAQSSDLQTRNGVVDSSGTMAEFQDHSATLSNDKILEAAKQLIRINQNQTLNVKKCQNAEVQTMSLMRTTVSVAVGDSEVERNENVSLFSPVSSKVHRCKVLASKSVGTDLPVSNSTIDPELWTIPSITHDQTTETTSVDPSDGITTGFPRNRIKAKQSAAPIGNAILQNDKIFCNLLDNYSPLCSWDRKSTTTGETFVEHTDSPSPLFSERSKKSNLLRGKKLRASTPSVRFDPRIKCSISETVSAKAPCIRRTVFDPGDRNLIENEKKSRTGNESLSKTIRAREIVSRNFVDTGMGSIHPTNAEHLRESHCQTTHYRPDRNDDHGERNIGDCDHWTSTNAWHSLRDELIKIKKRIFEEEHALTVDRELSHFTDENSAKNGKFHPQLGSVQNEVNDLLVLLGMKRDVGESRPVPVDLLQCSTEAEKICEIIEKHVIEKRSNLSPSAKTPDLRIQNDKRMMAECIDRVATMFDDIRIPAETPMSSMDTEPSFATSKLELPLGDANSSEIRRRCIDAPSHHELGTSTIDQGHRRPQCIARAVNIPPRPDDSESRLRNLLSWKPAFVNLPVDQNQQLQRLTAVIARASERLCHKQERGQNNGEQLKAEPLRSNYDYSAPKFIPTNGVVTTPDNGIWEPPNKDKAPCLEQILPRLDRHDASFVRESVTRQDTPAYTTNTETSVSLNRDKRKTSNVTKPIFVCKENGNSRSGITEQYESHVRSDDFYLEGRSTGVDSSLLVDVKSTRARVTPNLRSKSVSTHRQNLLVPLAYGLENCTHRGIFKKILRDHSRRENNNFSNTTWSAYD